MRIPSIAFVLVVAGFTSSTSHGFPPLKWNIESKSSRLGKFPECMHLLAPLLDLEARANALETEAIVQGKESVVYAKMSVTRELLRKVWDEVESFSSRESEENTDSEIEEVYSFLERLSEILSEVLEDPGLVAIINEHRYNRQQGIQQKALFCWSFVSGAYLLSGPTYFIGTLGISATGIGWKAYDRFWRDTRTFLSIDALKQGIETTRDALKGKYPACASINQLKR